MPVQPVIGDYIGADNEIVRVDKFPAGSQCRGEGEIGVVDEQTTTPSMLPYRYRATS